MPIAIYQTTILANLLEIVYKHPYKNYGGKPPQPL